MDHSAGQSQRSIEEQQVAVTESMGRVEARVQETVEGPSRRFIVPWKSSNRFKRQLAGLKAQSMRCSSMSKAR